MTLEQKYLLTLLSYAMKGQRLQSLPEQELDWMELVREARDQSVSMLVFDVVSQLQLPEEAYQKLFRNARRNTAGNMRMEHAQAELVSALDSGGYPYVILKGQSAAIYYPEPSLRILGDVDFLVPRSMTESVAETMKALDYAHSWEPGDYHQLLEKNGTCLELHMQIAGMPKGEAGVPVEQYLSDIYEKSIVAGEQTMPFRTPCAAHHGLILLLHMQHHVVARGMGLRHIMDWACFVDKTRHESFWEESLLPLLKQIGLYRFAAVFTKLAALYLDIACPQWASFADESVCHDLMQDMIDAGNFGRKDQDRSRSVGMIPDWEQKTRKSRLALLWESLQHSAKKSHPRLSRNPVGLFLAMCIRVIRYAALFAVGKRPNLLKAAGHAGQRRNLYEELHMYEPEQ